MRFLLLLPVVLLLACPSSSATDDDDDATLDDWTLQIDNNSGVLFTVLQQRPCPSTDPADFNELALPAGGLEPGGTRRWLLPTPGCYFLVLEGGGCSAETEAGPLQLGDQYTWDLDDDDLTCEVG